jgi:hypothetical protein
MTREAEILREIALRENASVVLITDIIHDHAIIYAIFPRFDINEYERITAAWHPAEMFL